jgi:hypothetical protein
MINIIGYFPYDNRWRKELKINMEHPIEIDEAR